MRIRPNRIFPNLLRPTICVPAGLGLFFVAASLWGQRPLDDTARRGMERIDQEEGARRLDSFREQRLAGDYVFDFQLEHKPRRAPTVRYDGILWGTWNEQGALTRLKIFAPDDSDGRRDSLLELIVQNGPNPKAWIQRDPSAEFELMVGEALFEPLLPGLVYSVFDLQMPFIYWEHFTYEGPDLFGASRVAQNFLMFPPDGSESQRQGIQAVRVGLDDTYNALWRIEIIDRNREVRSRFAVRSFQKVDDQYIVKRITLTEYPEKDATTFHVVEAKVGLQLDDDIFRAPGAPIHEQAESACSPQYFQTN